MEIVMLLEQNVSIQSEDFVTPSHNSGGKKKKKEKGFNIEATKTESCGLSAACLDRISNMIMLPNERK